MFFRFTLFILFSGLTLAATAPTFPVLAYSTYLRDGFDPKAIATDSSGNIYLAGNVRVDPSSSLTNVLVVKLNPRATAYLYVRYLAGSLNDTAFALAVDRDGNAYVAGVTTSPDFPVTSGGNLGTTPTTGTERSFVTKLDTGGQVVFSDLLGGSANSLAQAVAVNASGQVLVSGTSISSGFPSSPGVYSVTDTTFSPYLLELDPSGKRMIFSATGIGGTSVTFDSLGNIYMAGTTSSLKYPTTPGTFQPVFPAFQTCVAPCHGSFQGGNQYVTKLDPTGSKFIFSTAVSGTGNTLNNGLAVDAQGNVYLTGLAGAGYPFTVTPPSAPLGPALSLLSTPALPFLSKLDPAGQKLLFSVPVGGTGVQMDPDGFAYVGGILGPFGLFDVAAILPALSNIPAACVKSEILSVRSAYVSQVDTSGNVTASQFIGGSSLIISGIAFSGTRLWIAGATNLPDFAFSPNALTSYDLKPTPLPGAYLGAEDFSKPQPPATAPQIGCIVDPAGLQQAGPIVPNQVLTIFGTGLGPANPAIASDNSTTTLGGVSVSFGSLPAPLLYVSSNQINVAVPQVPVGPQGTMIQVTVDGVPSPPLQYAVTAANPTLFVVPGSYETGVAASAAVALNADGSQNVSTNPAKLGSLISVFVNGLRLNPGGGSLPPALYGSGGWQVTSLSQPNPFVVKVDLQLPSSSQNLYCQLPNTTACIAGFKLFELNSYLAPAQPGSTGGLSFGGFVYVTR